MISKNRLKELAAYRMQKRCDEEGVFVVEGPKMAAEAMASGFTIRVVCATGEWLGMYSSTTAERRSPSPNVGEEPECHEVSDAELERLSNMKTPTKCGCW